MIHKRGTIPGYGEVWYDKEATSNMFSLIGMVKRGQKVTLDSYIKNAFRVDTRDGRNICFPIDSRSLYVKEKAEETERRLRDKRDNIDPRVNQRKSEKISYLL